MRGRSTSVERAQRNLMSRTQQTDFFKTLTCGDRMEISWRIVDLQSAPPTEGDVPFVVMTGTVTEREEDSCIVNYNEQGIHRFPPQDLSTRGAFIEVRSLKKLPRPPLSFGHISLKRDREEQEGEDRRHDRGGRGNPSPDLEHVVKGFVEAIKGEEIVKKIQVAPGLRVTDDRTRKYHPFQIYSWYLQLKATGDETTTSTVWMVELSQALADLGVGFNRASPGDLLAYTTARDQMQRWLISTLRQTLTTKDEWCFGYTQLFQLLGSIVQIKFGYMKGYQCRQELQLEFEKPAALVDVGTTLNKFFRGRVREGSTSSSADKPEKRKKGGKERRIGADTQSPGAMQCRWCKKWHQGPAGTTGRAFWGSHKCK